MKMLTLIIFKIKASKITRGHNLKLVKEQNRLDVRNYSFSQRTINVWNQLSTDCGHTSSVKMFMNRIDKYVVNKIRNYAHENVPLFCFIYSNHHFLFRVSTSLI